MNRLLPISIAAALVSSSPALAGWSGEIAEEDGVPHVRNPETPMNGEVDVELEELWRVGGDDEDVLFGVITQLIEDAEGNLYLLDSQLSEIQVFSPDGEHLRTIGRRGEGPGEWQQGFDLFQGSDGLLGVVQIFPGKVIQLMTDGTPADNLRLPEVDGGGFQLVYRVRSGPEHLVISGGYQKGSPPDAQQIIYLKAFDKEGSELAHYHYESNPTRFGGMKFREEVFSSFATRFAVAPDGRVACATDFHDYDLHVWKPDGTLERVIQRPGYEPVPRTGAQKKRYQTLYDAITSWNPGSSFTISPTHVTVSNLQFRDDGTLWVLPSRGIWSTPDGVFAAYDVYDEQGRYLRRVNLIVDADPEQDAVFFLGDRCFIVTDFVGAQMSNLGGDDETDLEGDLEPISVVAYRMKGLDAAR